MKNVDWSSYAEVYDMILEYNSAYQEIVTKFQNEIADWKITREATFLDIGAGTGNFTLAAARAFPNNVIYHLDSDPQMTSIAKNKAIDRGFPRIQFISGTIESLEWTKLLNLQAIICVHALYTMKNPLQVIKNMYNFLAVGGYIFLCDAGRILNILDWSKFYGMYLLRHYGFITTAKVFWHGRQVLKQNRIIHKLQSNGTYWTHSHEEFCKIIEYAGFKLINTEKVFRGYSDLVVATKI